MDHGDCPVVSSKPSDPQQRRPDGRMYFVETAEQLGSDTNGHYRKDVRPSVHPSVYVDVIPRHCIRTTQDGITRSLLLASCRTLVLGFRKAFPEIRKGSPRPRAVDNTEVEKICDFQPISRRISETVGDRAKVAINHKLEVP